MKLTVTGLFTVHRDKVTVPQRAVVVTGTVAHFVPGQQVQLFATVDGHVFQRRTLSVAHRLAVAISRRRCARRAPAM